MERHAILIVNDTFPKSEGSLGPLSTVANDLADMTEVLEKLRSPPFRVTPKVNGDAADINDTLDRVLNVPTAEEDLFLIYYAGHGRILKEEGKDDALLLATYNSHSRLDKRYRDFEYSRIEEKLTEHRVKRAVIILDCCYSGAVGNEKEFRGEECPSVVPTPFSSGNYSIVPSQEAKADGSPISARDMGDGIYILTACGANQRAAGNMQTQRGEFTGPLVKVLKAVKDRSSESEAITLQAVYRDVFEAMKGLPQTPSLIKRRGEGSYLVIAQPGVVGERRKRSLTDWVPQSKDRIARLTKVSPMYLLDSGFRFVHWNAVFEDVIARQMGLVIGCHAMEFVNRLQNVSEVTNRNPEVFPTPSEADIEQAEETGEIWDGFPTVDVERLDFYSDRFGLIVFDKLALQIREPDYRKSTTWQVELCVRFVQRHDRYWENAKQVVKDEDLWTSYAQSYDAVVQKYPSYTNLVDSVVRQVEDRKNCLEIGAGTGNTTLALLRNPDRTVTAIESNDAMLEQLTKKLADYDKRTTILKGDAATVVNRILQERLEAKEAPEIFDACVMMNVLFALRDPSEILKLVYCVLKPEGILSISTPKMDAPVKKLMTNIRDWQSKQNPDEWAATNARAWKSAWEINLKLGKLAEDGRHDLDKVKQLALNAQFQIIGTPVDNEYDDCVILLKATKPYLQARSQPTAASKPLDVVPQPILTQDRPQDIEEPTEGEKVYPGRPQIKLFVSYARMDGNPVNDFLTKLNEQLGPSKNYEYRIWTDKKLLVGEEWNEEIQAALKQCDLGLLLVSPSFLSSDYILKEELAKFVQDDRKPMIPVLFDVVVDDRHDLKGLATHQIFALDSNGTRLAYKDCRGSAKRSFVRQLFRQLEQRVDKLRAFVNLGAEDAPGQRD